MSSMIARATRSVGTANPTSAERLAGGSRVGRTGLGAACKSAFWSAATARACASYRNDPDERLWAAGTQAKSERCVTLARGEDERHAGRSTQAEEEQSRSR